MTPLAVRNRSRRFHTLASYGELVIYWALVILFVLLQLSSGVWLVSDFNWIAFLDFDEAYQVEQFLGNMKEDSIEGLPNLIWAYGSELFVLIPFYKLTAAILGGASGLGAYRFLKVVHIIAGGLSLLLLRAVLRQIGAPRLVPLLVVVLVISSPLFYPYALHLKPDANTVLLLLLAGFWALNNFYCSGKGAWLVASIALGSLAAAIKWWGVFLLVPQVYLIMARDRASDDFKADIGLGSLVATNAIAGGLLLWVLVVQALPVLGRYLGKAEVVLGVVSLVLLVLASLSGFTACGWLLWKQICRRRTKALKWGNKLGRLAYRSLVTCSLFALGYLVFAFPFLVSDQLGPSIGHFSRYTAVRFVRTETALAIGSQLVGNVSEWANSVVESGLLPPLVIPTLFCSIVLLLRAPENKELWQRIRGLGIFTGVFVAFLFVLTGKKNYHTLAMLLPFVATVAVAPVAIWAVHLKAMRRNLVMTALVLLVVSQTVFQLERTLDVISSYPKAIHAISTMNGALSASIKKVSETDRDLTLFIPGREFPIHSGVSGTRRFSGSEYGALVNRLLGSCDGRQSGRRVADRDSSEIFLVLRTDRGSTFAAYLQRVEKLRNNGCLDLISEIVGDMYSRGGPDPDRVSFAVYRIRPREDIT